MMGAAKPFSGQTGNWNYYDVHELIFTQRRDETAWYICRELYKYFVYPEVDESIVIALAETFKANDFDLVPVYKQLFKSEHFFDETLIGAHIKSPLELFCGLFNTSELEYPADFNDDMLGYIFYQSINIGQQLFAPPNVSGWDGYRSWITENTMNKTDGVLSAIFCTPFPLTPNNDFATPYWKGSLTPTTRWSSRSL